MKTSFMTLPPVAAVFMGLLLSQNASAANPVDGKKHYQRYCASCHGQNGRPSIPVAADFSKGEGLLKPDRQIAQHIQKGRQACPSFRGTLDDNEILNVIAYIRTLY